VSILKSAMYFFLVSTILNDVQDEIFTCVKMELFSIQPLKEEAILGHILDSVRTQFLS